MPILPLSVIVLLAALQKLGLTIAVLRMSSVVFAVHYG
jgi:hypothetical protein